MVDSNINNFTDDNWFNPLKIIDDGLDYINNSLAYWSNVFNRYFEDNREQLVPIAINGINILHQLAINAIRTWDDIQNERAIMKQNYLNFMKVNYDIALMINNPK
jgi:hypothetical protein